MGLAKGEEIFGEKIIPIDDKIALEELVDKVMVTRWCNDPYALGSYSHTPRGAFPTDYDVFCKKYWDGMLYFAGEATCRKYPSTVHGAILSGERVAAQCTSSTDSSSSSIIISSEPAEKSSEKASASCNST